MRMYTVATHSGSFHADDVFAVATLQLVYGRDNLHIIRTRDDKKLATADIVVDVGGEYEVGRKRFDHHQNGAPIRDNGIPYAAFGLVWREYGAHICESAEVARQIEQKLVQPVDAGDTGMTLYNLKNKDIVPFELYQVVSSFAPPRDSNESKDDAFLKAVDFARGLLERSVVHQQAMEKMQALVVETYERTEDKRVLIFDVPVASSACIQYPEVLLVVCPDDPASNQNWVANAVRKELGTFENRVNFPAAWAGLRTERLIQVSGISDAVFCHKARFCFVAGSKEGVMTAVWKIL